MLLISNTDMQVARTILALACERKGKSLAWEARKGKDAEKKESAKKHFLLAKELRSNNGHTLSNDLLESCLL